MSAKTNDAIRAREQAKIRPAPPPKKAKKPRIVVEPTIAPDYAESAE